MTQAVRTPLSPEDAIRACWQAHQNVIGGPCATNLLTMLAAQSALETGRWRSMWNWNAGNIRGHGPTGESITIAGANEIVDGHVITGPSVEGGFAAYPNAVAGFEGLVRFLGVASHPPAPNRYALAWESAIAGDVYKYCQELRAHGYFTADLALYTKGVRAQFEWLESGAVPAFLQSLVSVDGSP